MSLPWRYAAAVRHKVHVLSLKLHLSLTPHNLIFSSQYNLQHTHFSTLLRMKFTSGTWELDPGRPKGYYPVACEQPPRRRPLWFVCHAFISPPCYLFGDLSVHRLITQRGIWGRGRGPSVPARPFWLLHGFFVYSYPQGFEIELWPV